MGGWGLGLEAGGLRENTQPRDQEEVRVVGACGASLGETGLDLCPGGLVGFGNIRKEDPSGWRAELRQMPEQLQQLEMSCPRGGGGHDKSLQGPSSLLSLPRSKVTKSPSSFLEWVDLTEAP